MYLYRPSVQEQSEPKDFYFEPRPDKIRQQVVAERGAQKRTKARPMVSTNNSDDDPSSSKTMTKNRLIQISLFTFHFSQDKERCLLNSRRTIPEAGAVSKSSRRRRMTTAWVLSIESCKKMIRLPPLKPNLPPAPNSPSRCIQVSHYINRKCDIATTIVLLQDPPKRTPQLKSPTLHN